MLSRRLDFETGEPRQTPRVPKMDNTGIPAPRPLPEKCPKREIVMEGEIVAARKPSERFFRSPIKARSRASQSERIRVAGLINSLEEKTGGDVMKNGEKEWRGYRPGHPQPPC